MGQKCGLFLLGTKRLTNKKAINFYGTEITILGLLMKM